MNDGDMFPELLLQLRHQLVVEFDDGQVGNVVQEQRCERSFARAYFDDRVSRERIEKADDLLRDVRILKKILAE